MSEPSEINPAELQKAFEVFNRVSGELDNSYRELENRVSGLKSELSKSRSAQLNELAEKECLANRLGALIAAIPGGVIILDASNNIQDCNPVAVEIFGEPLLGRHWQELFDGEEVPMPNLSSGQIRLRSKRIVSIESSYVDKTREQLVLVTDVTAIHQSQENISRQERLASLGEMAANLAHQIRTPLSSATLYLSQLNSSRHQWQERKRIQGKITESLSHMENLVTSMLIFTQGKDVPNHSVLVKDLLEELLVVVAPQIEKFEAKLGLPTLDKSLAIQVNLDEMVGVLINLIMNSIEVSDGPAEIDLWVGAVSSTQMQIVVSDNGPGIPDALLPQIFEPFFTTRAAGTGLGLSVAATTIENYGGTIRAANKEGGGAQLVISLPIFNKNSGQKAERGEVVEICQAEPVVETNRRKMHVR